MKADTDEQYRHAMRASSQMARWNHRAIFLCAVSALCICLSIAAVLALISGLLRFFRELARATGVIELRNAKNPLGGNWRG